MSTAPQDGSRPTIILVHGAFAESASWNGVIGHLQERGYTAIAVANPLRSIAGDAEYVAGLVRSIQGPVILVGHSYGGAVISGAAVGNDNVKALVFVSAYAAEEGETLSSLTGKFPGSTLADTLAPVPLGDGSSDLYIRPDKYHDQFEADVPMAQATLDAATQRPLRDVTLAEPAGPPAWKTIPSWFVFSELDKNIPVAAHRFMAERAGAREVVEVEGASHAFAAAQPDIVADIILRAAEYVEKLPQQ